MTDDNMNERSDSKTDESTVRKKKVTVDDIAELSKMFRPFAKYPRLLNPYEPIDIEKLKFPRY